MRATHKYTGGKTNRQIANMALKAMSNIQEYDNGTIRNPHELASSVLKDGRTLIQTIYEDGYVDYNDGYYVVEVDEYCMYIDVTGRYLHEIDMTDVEYSMDYDKGLEPYEEEC
ncbi:hypothetical protein M2451_002635 [Dysgonomonas sp. PFB1-18]|uniref:hypothetical protein n=1 Tax=unclassified Dysgonomonas TaxID=2630389 RepID=UPI002475DF57|nr:MULTISPECIES: hypothetical protein [unclassified Dysgonomonas]MDH6308116.1 hypothetical protein [Dysgonomonas sp. PF1-14]MDH6339655.1 hypothetical protein [Dysgonomonas sp. PF1-16]MDH6381306.1 hypothetical protein [Dysgonomonas sp. PFB1-18]MDH6398518.1 hypothetical protein [Dysgonomonas sp. PF1-23]